MRRISLTWFFFEHRFDGMHAEFFKEISELFGYACLLTCAILESEVDTDLPH